MAWCDRRKCTHAAPYRAEFAPCQHFHLAHDVLPLQRYLGSKANECVERRTVTETGRFDATTLLSCLCSADRQLGGISVLDRAAGRNNSIRSPTRSSVSNNSGVSTAGAKSSGADAEVVAEVDFNPPASKGYNIRRWSGSARGKQVVERILDHEVETAASESLQTRTGLTRVNYDFSLVGESVLDGRPCYLLGLKPKRKEKDLILGKAWVDKNSFSVLRIEGETAKTPSWWLKSVHVTLAFGDLGGNWLQTSVEAVADVRFLGSHTLTSRILDYRGTDVTASRILPAHLANRRSRTEIAPLLEAPR